MLKRITASFKADNRYILPDGKSGCVGLNQDSEYSGLLSVGLLCNGCPPIRLAQHCSTVVPNRCRGSLADP